MQKAKDSFFAALRDRLEAINGGRTVSIDGQQRPGILVSENESAGLEDTLWDVFCLEWGAVEAVAANVAGSPVAMDCAIRYRTAGSSGTNGLDRGRKLAEMDEELRKMLTVPSAEKLDYTLSPARDLGTKVFWTEPSLKAAEFRDRGLIRTATVKVYFYPEVGQ